MANGRAKALHCFIEFEIEHATSYAELVDRIAGELQLKAVFPTWLSNAVAGDHGVCFGSASQNLDLIADQLNLEWNIKNDVLRMEPLGAARSAAKAASLLSPFQAEAGVLMSKARRTESKRVAPGEYERIARKLDARAISLLDNLEPTYRRALASWNQKHGRHQGKAVHTWSQAIASNAAIRRGATKTLSRAEERYKDSLAFGAPWIRKRAS